MHHHNSLHFSCKPYMRSQVLMCNESVVNLTALSREVADDVTWAHTPPSAFLHSQLKLFDYFCV